MGDLPSGEILEFSSSMRSVLTRTGETGVSYGGHGTIPVGDAVFPEHRGSLADDPCRYIFFRYGKRIRESSKYASNK